MKYFAWIVTLGLFLTVAAQAVNPTNLVPDLLDEFRWNQHNGPVAHNTRMGTKVLRAHTIAYGAWDYTKTGGAIADHEVGITLPNNAIVRRAWFSTIENPSLSGLPTIAFKVQSAADLKAATAANGWAADVIDGALDGTVGAYVKLTAQRKVYATIASAAATKGKIEVFIDYVLSN
jgi:hypothetical protein